MTITLSLNQTSLRPHINVNPLFAGNARRYCHPDILVPCSRKRVCKSRLIPWRHAGPPGTIFYSVEFLLSHLLDFSPSHIL